MAVESLTIAEKRKLATELAADMPALAVGFMLTFLVELRHCWLAREQMGNDSREGFAWESELGS